MPTIMVNDEVDNEQGEEGNSGEGMGPPNIAGTSSESTQEFEQGEEILGDDGVYFPVYFKHLISIHYVQTLKRI